MHTSVIVVMGVSGSGKTAVGTLLARRLGWPFADADAFHPPGNVAKMRAGIALTDADRGPWLEAIARWIDAARATGNGGVVACSALKRRYREQSSAGAMTSAWSTWTATTTSSPGAWPNARTTTCR